MTTYGTIPTSSHESPVVDLESNLHAKQCIKTYRPWRMVFDFHSMALPHGVSDAFSRIKTNLGYFQMNYVIVFLIIILIDIFVSLIKHPISLVVFTVLIIVWFLYFRLDEPIKLFRYHFVDWMFRFCLAWITVALLMFTKATYNMAVVWLIGAVVVLVHTVVRKTEDHFMDEEAATTETSCKWVSHIRALLFLSLLLF